MNSRRKLANPTAFKAANKIIGILECLKEYDLVKTITADNVLQFADHVRVSEETDVAFFFERHGFLSPDDIFSKMTVLDTGRFV